MTKLESAAPVLRWLTGGSDAFAKTSRTGEKEEVSVATDEAQATVAAER